MLISLRIFTPHDSTANKAEVLRLLPSLVCPQGEDTFTLPREFLPELLPNLLKLVRTHPWAIYIRQSHEPIGQLVTDLDGCLLATELMPLFASQMGKGKAMARLTEQAMAGDLPFQESFLKRTEMLRGLSVEAIEQMTASAPLCPTAEESIEMLRAHSIPWAIASGAYTQAVGKVAQLLGAEHYIGSHPEILHGRLTGRLIGTPVSPADKADYLDRMAEHWGSSTRTILSLGDGANDLQMLMHSGHSLLYSSAQPDALALLPILATLYSLTNKRR